MKAVNHYLVIERIKDEPTKVGGLILTEELDDDNRYLKAKVISIGDNVEGIHTDDKNTVITTLETTEDVSERIKQVEKLKKNEKNGFLKKFIEQRLAMLSGSVGIVRVGADSKVELKEKKDRVEDAIYATKAALKEGIVPGGGIALLNASQYIIPDNVGETILLNAIQAPFETILRNAGIEDYEIPTNKGVGIDVISSDIVDMVDFGIIDPLLVAKTALKNAVSVVSTIISANCVISNIRVDESS